MDLCGFSFSAKGRVSCKCIAPLIVGRASLGVVTESYIDNIFNNFNNHYHSRVVEKTTWVVLRNKILLSLNI